VTTKALVADVPGLGDADELLLVVELQAVAIVPITNTQEVISNARCFALWGRAVDRNRWSSEQGFMSSVSKLDPVVHLWIRYEAPQGLAGALPLGKRLAHRSGGLTKELQSWSVAPALNSVFQLAPMHGRIRFGRTGKIGREGHRPG